MTIWTIGHSTRTAEQLIALLKAHGIEQLADIRRIPRSRRNPQFNVDELPSTLSDAGISYRHLPGLGGMRHPSKDSVNTAWRNDSFRGYADYMLTAEFERNLDELSSLSEQRPTAMMCAEALPWQCHRSLVADVLTARGIEVRHIMTGRATQAHVLTPFARIEGKLVVYPGLPLPTLD